ncbi:MAG TPA: polyprenol monophosphomannose synthase [Candidatus Nanopelagicaceae bacterium]
MTMKALVMIPTYNEAESIGTLVTQLLDHFPDLEVLVIDDNSPDGTADLIKGLHHDRLHLLERRQKSGLGAAYRAGIRWAMDHSKYTHYVTMDGDGSHRVEDLSPMLGRAANVDVVMSSRWIPGGSIRNWPKYRQFISHLGTSYAKLALKLPYTDLTGGFRVYSAHLISSLNVDEISSEGYCFQIEMILASEAAGATFAEVPITFVERELGRSKMSRRIVIEALGKVSLWGWRTRFGSNADKLHYVK